MPKEPVIRTWAAARPSGREADCSATRISGPNGVLIATAGPKCVRRNLVAPIETIASDGNLRQS